MRASLLLLLFALACSVPQPQLGRSCREPDNETAARRIVQRPPKPEPLPVPLPVPLPKPRPRPLPEPEPTPPTIP
jgi:hypothetical protein